MARGYDQTPRLIGRERELSALHGFMRKSAIDGGALLLSGEPGVGKSALLQVAAELAAEDEIRVIRCEGVEYESDVSFAGLHQLVDPLADHLQRLPLASRGGLRAALGIGSGSAPVPDRLTVMSASLALFRAAASSTPLLVIIDDMHWLDRATASVIGFVGRRLAGSPIGVLGSTRPGSSGFFERTGWSELVVPPLGEDDAMELLAHQFAHLPTRVMRDVAREAQGNPLALLEFAAAVAHPRGGAGADRGSTSGREIRALYATRIDRLPTVTRRLLLLAVLDGSGSLSGLVGVSGAAGLKDLGPAELDHLIVIDERAGEIRFRHPLIKSAVVDLSTHDERREAHQRLAEVFADQPERRGHHVAESAEAPDEFVAALIEEGARRTLQRGDVVGAVGRLLRAADLSTDRSERSRRLAHAAFIGAFAAGELKSSSQLLRDAKRRDPTLGETLEAAVATAYMLLNSDGDATVAHTLLTGAIGSALAEPDHDREALSRGLYTLVVMCHYAGRVDYWENFDDLVGQMEETASADAVLLAETFAAPLTASRSALAALDRQVEQLNETLDVERIIRTGIASFYTDRLGGCREALDRVVRDGRESGAAASVLMALAMIAFDDLGAGRWDAAKRAADDAGALADELGYLLYGSSSTYAAVLIAARRGDLAACAAGCEAMLAWAAPRRLGRLEDYARHALGEAALAAGAFEEAYAYATAIGEPGSLHTHDPQALWSALDLVDAAVHTGRTDEALSHAVAMRDADLGRLSPRFALITAAASAMVAPDAEAPRLFEESLSLPAIAQWPFELARVQLAYGERLRRMRHTRDARTQLQAALQGFNRLGATPWSQRVSTELRATGPTRQIGGLSGVDSLTPQELEVARLAASGLTNREIASRLYLSPRTVSAHLYRAFPKLGIATRAALRDALDGASGDK